MPRPETDPEGPVSGVGWSGIPISIRAPSMSLGKIDSRAFCRLMKRTTATPTHVKMVESVWKVFVFAKRGERVVFPPPWAYLLPALRIERADSDGTELEARGGSGPGDLVLSRATHGDGRLCSRRPW